MGHRQRHLLSLGAGGFPPWRAIILPRTQARSKAILTPGVVPLEISIRESDGDVTILDLRGRATISDGESDLLGARLDQLIANGTHKFILNLAELTHVDSPDSASLSRCVFPLATRAVTYDSYGRAAPRCRPSRSCTCST